MQRIVIEASSPANMEHLLALLKQLDFVRNVWLEAANPVDEFVLAGPPMPAETFMERIREAESEDAEGNSIADEDLTINF
jgi:hypothetical protein